MQFNKLAVAVALATTDAVATIDTSDLTSLAIEVKNAGANDLDAFSVFGKVSDNGDELSLLSLATDYTNKVYPCLQASASPVALAAGGSVWVLLDVTAFAQITLKASSAVGATTLNLHGVGK